jgi:hypothetical protein
MSAQSDKTVTVVTGYRFIVYLDGMYDENEPGEIQVMAKDPHEAIRIAFACYPKSSVRGIRRESRNSIRRIYERPEVFAFDTSSVDVKTKEYC